MICTVINSTRVFNLSIDNFPRIVDDLEGLDYASIFQQTSFTKKKLLETILVEKYILILPIRNLALCVNLT